MFCENKCLFQSVKKPDRKGNKSESLVQAIKANVRRFFFMNKKNHMKLKTKQLYHIQLTEDISKKTIKLSVLVWYSDRILSAVLKASSMCSVFNARDLKI